MSAQPCTFDRSRTYHFGDQEISGRDFATFILPVVAVLGAKELGITPPGYVFLSPRFKRPELPAANIMPDTPKLWIGPDDRLRLAWLDQQGRPMPEDTYIVTGVLRVEEIQVVMLHTDNQEVYCLDADEFYSQV
jgi:hypothetical protein